MKKTLIGLGIGFIIPLIAQLIYYIGTGNRLDLKIFETILACAPVLGLIIGLFYHLMTEEF